MADSNRNGTLALWIGTAASVATLCLTPALSGGSQPTSVSQAAANDNQIWYNRLTGFYHRVNCRFYMQTKEGMMLTLPEAERLGHACATCFNPPKPKRQTREKGAVEKRIMLVP